jgi:hypothetical protein
VFRRGEDQLCWRILWGELHILRERWNVLEWEFLRHMHEELLLHWKRKPNVVQYCRKRIRYRFHGSDEREPVPHRILRSELWRGVLCSHEQKRVPEKQWVFQQHYKYLDGMGWHFGCGRI